MKYIVYLSVLVTVFPLSASARLGETEAQLAARFGAAVSRGKEITVTQGKVVEFGARLSFRQGDWTIECVIVDDRCAKETYHKPGEWTEDQFTTILSANAQGARWTDVSNASNRKIIREWHREDSATAFWNMGVAMIVTHPAYGRAKEKAEAKAKADAGRIPKI